MNRREFLVGGLALAGMGALGCHHRPPQAPSPALPAGARRDPNFQQGHRLRTEDFPREASRQETCRVAILGGGISGLSAGWRLRHEGLDDLLLLELEDSLGGNSRCLSYPTSEAPIGAHYLPIPNVEARAVRRVLEEMGVLREVASGRWELDGDSLCHSPQERVHYLGRWYEGLLPDQILDEESARQVESFHHHIEEWKARRDPEGRKVFALPLALSSPRAEYTKLDDISFAEYARRQGWTSPLLTWYLEYACRDDFGGTLANCSAWAGLHYFASRDGGGLGDSDDILVWPEGNHRLVRHLAEAVGAHRCRAQSLVLSVVPSESSVAIDYLDLVKQERIRVRCEAAIFCLPTFLRPFLVKGEKRRAEFVYAPWVTANLELSATPADSQGAGFVAWDNVLYGRPSLGYVVATHQQMAFDPLRPTVWTWYRPFADGNAAEHRQQLLESRWEDWVSTVFEELETVHPDIRQKCRRLDVTVLGHGMIRPSVGFLWGQEIQAAREARGRLFFGHGDLSGMSLFEESQYRGVLAAEDVLRALGQEPKSFL